MSTETNTARMVEDALTQRGNLFELRISRWSGRARLEEADLGLEGLTDADLHHLGRRQLVPAAELKKIAKIEARARARLQASSYAFPVGGGRFVPIKMLGNLMADLARIRDSRPDPKHPEDDSKLGYLAAVESFIARYEELAAETRQAWRANAERLKAELGKDDAWLEAFEMRLANSYPPVEKVRECFSMEWDLYELTLPKDLRARLITADASLEAARMAEQARAQMEARVSNFIGEAALELRRRVGDALRHVAEQVTKSGAKVTERTLQPLRDLIKQFRDLDFTDDNAFAQQLDAFSAQWLGVDQQAGTAGRLREDADYRQAVSEALNTMSETALAESEKAAAEALERFLKHGNAGRAVAG